MPDLICMRIAWTKFVSSSIFCLSLKKSCHIRVIILGLHLANLYRYIEWNCMHLFCYKFHLSPVPIKLWAIVWCPSYLCMWYESGRLLNNIWASTDHHFRAKMFLVPLSLFSRFRVYIFKPLFGFTKCMFWPLMSNFSSHFNYAKP